MRWLFWWFRTLACKHVWELEARNFVFFYHGGGRSEETIVSATCATCGWHRSYKKW